MKNRKNLFLKYPGSIEDKLDNFEKYIRRQALARFLARYELFKKIISVKGSIVECGVHLGGGVLAWAKLSSNFEPVAIARKVIGFDTFCGFPGVSEKDCSPISENLEKFNPKYNSYEELLECIEEYDNNRFLNQFPKVELIKGDAVKTIPTYINNNKHLIVSLLFMDFDLYEPSKIALEHFIPRMPKGGVIAFDEINNEHWAGETLAVLETFGSLNKLELRKFPFDPNIAYIVL